MFASSEFFFQFFTERTISDVISNTAFSSQGNAWFSSWLTTTLRRVRCTTGLGSLALTRAAVGLKALILGLRSALIEIRWNSATGDILGVGVLIPFPHIHTMPPTHRIDR